MEEILNRGLPYTSGPQWIGEHILHDKWVLAVAGTHGKTTTSSMLAWILEDAGYHPGFLIGGVPMNFGISARLSGKVADSDFFVIEADEYDTAFFDKRSKFVHYHAKTAILNNLEYDHADIFPDLARDRNPIPSLGAHRARHRPPGRQWPRSIAATRAGARLLEREGMVWRCRGMPTGRSATHDDGSFDVLLQRRSAGHGRTGR